MFPWKKSHWFGTRHDRRTKTSQWLQNLDFEVSHAFIQNYINSITLHLLIKWILSLLPMWYIVPGQWFLSDYSRIIESWFKAEPWVCVIRHTVKWNSNSTERGTALHVPSDHLSPEPGKDNNVPRAKPTAFPQPVQWLACISYRHLFSFLNNWQGIWAALREEEELWTSLQIFWFWCH